MFRNKSNITNKFVSMSDFDLCAQNCREYLLKRIMDYAVDWTLQILIISG